MNRKFVCLLLAVSFFASTCELFAKPGGSSSSSRSSSSSSRSYSSSPSRSSSSPSRSYSSPSKPSTPSKSYSSSSSNKPAAPSTPSKSYSSSSSNKPSTPSKSYSSSSSNKPAAPSTPSTPNKSYSSSSKPATPVTPSASNSTKPNSAKPSGNNSFNSGLSNSAKQEQSRIKYQAATTPKPSYKTPKGETKPIQNNSPQVQTVRKYVTHERYVTYDNRYSTFYHGYNPMPYNDFFSPFLMGYLFSSAINSSDRAAWMYHHRNEMDDSRYREMLAKDASLQAQIDALEKQNVPRDPNYVVPSMSDNPDLQYTKEFVDAAYNPVEKEEGLDVGKFLFWSFVSTIILACLVYTFYVFFVKEF